MVSLSVVLACATLPYPCTLGVTMTSVSIAARTTMKHAQRCIVHVVLCLHPFAACCSCTASHAVIYVIHNGCLPSFAVNVVGILLGSPRLSISVKIGTFIMHLHSPLPSSSSPFTYRSSTKLSLSNTVLVGNGVWSLLLALYTPSLWKSTSSLSVWSSLTNFPFSHHTPPSHTHTFHPSSSSSSLYILYMLLVLYHLEDLVL